jgi:hypothetical protein
MLNLIPKRNFFTILPPKIYNTGSCGGTAILVLGMSWGLKIFASSVVLMGSALGICPAKYAR